MQTKTKTLKDDDRPAKFAPTGAIGILLGYKLHPGGKWRHEYIVGDVRGRRRKVDGVGWCARGALHHDATPWIADLIPEIGLIVLRASEDVSYGHDVDGSILRLVRVGVTNKKRLNVAGA